MSKKKKKNAHTAPTLKLGPFNYDMFWELSAIRPGGQSKASPSMSFVRPERGHLRLLYHTRWQRLHSTARDSEQYNGKADEGDSDLPAEHHTSLLIKDHATEH